MLGVPFVLPAESLLLGAEESVPGGLEVGGRAFVRQDARSVRERPQHGSTPVTWPFLFTDAALKILGKWPLCLRSRDRTPRFSTGPAMAWAS